MDNPLKALQAWMDITMHQFNISVPPVVLKVTEYGTVFAVSYVAGAEIAEKIAERKINMDDPATRGGVRIIFGGTTALMTTGALLFGPIPAIATFVTTATVFPYVFLGKKAKNQGKVQKKEKPQEQRQAITTHKDVNVKELQKALEEDIEKPVAPKPKVAQTVPAAQEIQVTGKPQPQKATEQKSPEETAKKEERKAKIASTQRGGVLEKLKGILHRANAPKTTAQKAQEAPKKKENVQERKVEKEKEAYQSPGTKKATKTTEHIAPEAEQIVAILKEEEQKEKSTQQEAHTPKREEHRHHAEKKAKKGRTAKNTGFSVGALLKKIVPTPKSAKNGELQKKEQPKKPPIKIEEFSVSENRIETKAPEVKKSIKVPSILPKRAATVEEIEPSKEDKRETEKKEEQKGTTEKEVKATTTQTAKPTEQKPTEPQDPEVEVFRAVLKDMEKKYILEKQKQKIQQRAEKPTTEAEEREKSEPKKEENKEEQKQKTEEKEKKKLRPRDVDRAVKKILDELKKNVEQRILQSTNKPFHTWRERRAAKDAAEAVCKKAEPIIRQRIMETGSTDIDVNALVEELMGEVSGEAASPKPEETKQRVIRHEDISKIAEEVYEQIKTAMGKEPTKTREHRHGRHGTERAEETEEAQKNQKPTAEENKHKKTKPKKEEEDEDILSLLGGDEETADTGDEDSDLLGLDLSEEGESDEDMDDLKKLLGG